MKKGRLSTIILIVFLLVGLSLLLYPTVSNYWNSLHQSRAIAEYVEQVADLSGESYEKFLNDARVYNQSLLAQENPYVMTAERQARYDALLNVSGNGILGYVEVPSIDCALPIYHGVEDTVLQIAVGHIAGSTLPIGGENTHSVLSGHRGLPSARLFTDLDKVAIGDYFTLRVLDETLTYEVDQILIVEPHETSALTVEKGKDYCTLVTCTPYGINTHRLLVRGTRVENRRQSEAARITADAMQVDARLVAPVVAMPVLLVLLILLFVKTPRRRKKQC
ncbi:MAG: class C sortase [Faecalimonas sp.]|nr:class C sortase [Faecalimonas sp.]